MIWHMENLLFSIIIPIYDRNAYLLPFTLDSIAQQSFTSYEVILIDGQTGERRENSFHTYHQHVAHIYSALDRNFSAMLNKGVELAKGRYLNFIFPGEFYLSHRAFHHVQECIAQGPPPDLLYSGSILRHSHSKPQLFFRQIDLADLKTSRVSMSLHPYWFHRDAILALDKFTPRYHLQGGFDLLCRLYARQSYRKVFLKRVITDYEFRLLPPKYIMRQSWETLLIVMAHFGLSGALFWWISKNSLRLMRWWGRSIKLALWRKE